MGYTLGLVTEGYLCGDGNYTLSLVTRGHLGCVTEDVVIPVPPKIPITGDGGGYSGVSIDKGKRVKLNLKDPYKTERKNKRLMIIIKTFMRCQDENIL